MLPQFWKSSDEWLETSSGGPLLTDFTTLLNLRRSSEVEEPSWGVHATFQGTVNSTREEITFLAEAAGENAIKRIFSCVIISAMPETGVDEALTTLKDI